MAPKKATQPLTIDRETKCWRPIEDDDEQVYRAIVEKAKTGRARCRHCDEPIETNTYRIGIPIKWRGYISSWRHPKCFFLPDGEEPLDLDAGEVYGLELVSDAEELSTLARELKKKAAEDVQEKFDPNASVSILPKEPVPQVAPPPTS